MPDSAWWRLAAGTFVRMPTQPAVATAIWFSMVRAMAQRVTRRWPRRSSVQ